MNDETTTTDDRINDLIDAASAIAFARRQRMDTAEEWDDLERAVLAAQEAPADEQHPCLGFRSELLMRYSRLPSGTIESRSCTAYEFEQIAHAIEAKAGGWFVVQDLAEEIECDWTTAYVAVEFLRYRGMVRMTETGHRLEAAAEFRANTAIADFIVAITLKDMPYTFR